MDTTVQKIMDATIQHNINAIKQEAFDRFGGSVSVNYENVNGKEKVTVQSFAMGDNDIMEEVHYGSFSSLAEANKYYFSPKMNELQLQTIFNGGDFEIKVDDNGVYYLDGYESKPVNSEDIENRINAENDNSDNYQRYYKATVAGYYPDDSFNEKNGKIYLRVMLDIPMVVRHDDPKNNGDIEQNYTGTFKSLRIGTLIRRLRSMLSSTSTKVNTDLGTNMSIYELALNGKKVERV